MEPISYRYSLPRANYDSRHSYSDNDPSFNYLSHQPRVHSKADHSIKMPYPKFEYQQSLYQDLIEDSQRHKSR